MADITVSVTGVQAIVNPTRWNAQNTPYGEGAWNTGGFTSEDVIPGWGHLSWGRANWGDLDIYEEGWGRSTWGNEPWGGTHNKVVSVTGLSVTASLGTVTPVTAVTVEPTGLEVTSSLGTVTPVTDVTVAPTGVSSTASIGSVTVAEQVMGLTGVSATASIGSVSVIDQAVGVSLDAMTA
ncbi:MAG: hypothetical protein VX199_07710, partial [Chloroflexota bacterium]|nr:hypothetical protein [Chloroflexota bacterium]